MEIQFSMLTYGFPIEMKCLPRDAKYGDSTVESIPQSPPFQIHVMRDNNNVKLVIVFAEITLYKKF